METPLKDSTPTAKRHSRHVSYNRATLTRRTTKGPLDVDDPLSDHPQPTPVKDHQEAPLSTPSLLGILSPSPGLATFDDPVKDFSYLLRPEIYHPLTQVDIPPPFRSSSNAPSPDAPLPKLLSTGHFRPAATLAAVLLTGSPAPTHPNDIFSLLYVRLACLALIGATALAAQEVKALGDLGAPFYRHSVTDKHLVPWELRVLAVRLLGIGYGDGRRVVVGYYELARDARAEIGKAGSTREKECWRARLRDLGVRAAGALVELGDLAAAGRHLEGLLRTDGEMEGGGVMRGRVGLLYLRIGDVGAARRLMGEGPATDSYAAVLQPLRRMAEGDYAAAVTQFAAMRDEAASRDPLVLQNLAVCLIYMGRLVEARPLLEGLVADGHSFHTLLLNLSTVYELCSDKGRSLKMELVERLAGREGGAIGWEKLNAEFKL